MNNLIDKLERADGPDRDRINLLRDIRMKGAIDALLFSKFRHAGTGLRAAGLIGGIGDNTHITEKGMALVLEADEALRARSQGGE